MIINNLERLTTIPNGAHNEQLIQKIRQLFYNWHWFALSLIICLCFGFVFLRYSTPKYEINASVLVKDDTKGTDFGEAALLESLGLSSGKSNVDNEVEILKSRTLMESVVKDLQLYVRYFASGNVKTTEIYEKSPFLLTYTNPKSNKVLTRETTYFVSFKGKNQFEITDNINTWRQTFGDTFLLPNGPTIINKTLFKPVPEDTYSVKISGIEQTVTKYSQELSVSATNKLVSIISLKMTDILPVKAEIILEKLIKNYLLASVTDKNRIADSTIAFIDQNLILVSNELMGIEKQIEDFRTANHVTDISEQTRLLLNNNTQYNKEKITTQVQLKVIESLLTFIVNNPSKVIPSSIIMQEAGFVSMVGNYNDTQLRRERALIGTTNEHPAVQNLNLQLTRIKEDLVSSITSKKRELQLSAKEFNKYAIGFQSKIDKIPAQERIFLDYARKQEIKQELYIFLLKKRVETAISKSSTIANGRIIDSAKADNIPVTPGKQLTLALAILLGISFPIIYFYLRDIFNTRITGKSDIINIINMPIIAEIGHNKLKSIDVIRQNSRDYITEQFRTLRTNVHFLSAVKTDQIILVTSSMAGEGKTFISVNLCTTLQLTGKKVILIEFDLRKPKIAGYLELKGKGLTDFIISDLAAKDIIQPSGISSHFDVITSGPIPPNPAELIMSPKIETLITQLKEKYDYIILDTAPIGLVTDARLLSHYADISLYVIRQKFTFRHQLEVVEDISRNNLLPKLNLILNDVKAIPGYGYKYGYNN